MLDSPNFTPNTTPILSFIADSWLWNMLGDSINIDNFNYNPVDMKKTGKTYNYNFFCPTCSKKGQYGSPPKQKTFFFFFFQK